MPDLDGQHVGSVRVRVDIVVDLVAKLKAVQVRRPRLVGRVPQEAKDLLLGHGRGAVVAAPARIERKDKLQLGRCGKLVERLPALHAEALADDLGGEGKKSYRDYRRIV